MVCENHSSFFILTKPQKRAFSGEKRKKKAFLLIFFAHFVFFLTFAKDFYETIIAALSSVDKQH